MKNADSSTRASRRRPLGALLTAPLLATALLATEAAATGPSLAQRSLTRVVDTVVIRGEDLGPRILGAHKDNVRVYACRSGYMIPILFQVDERNAEGTYCWDLGPRDRLIQDEDGGLIDDNDELVVLAEQAGDRARPESLAMVPGYSAVQEIELRDPLTGGLGWIYVYRFATNAVPGRAAQDLASLRIERHRNGERTHHWEGERFRFNNDLSRTNAIRGTHAVFSQPGTRDFSGATNLIDSTQVRAVVSFMWVRVVRQSDDMEVNIGGYIDGPLRVVAENQLRVYLALGLWASAPASYIVLTRNRVSMPTNASCPVNLDNSGESSYELTVDLRKAAAGWRFYNSHNPEPVVIDGRWSRAERDLDLTYPDWNCAFGPEGALISKFVVPDFLRERDDSRLVYLDDEYHERSEKGAEFEPGAFGHNGYRVDMRGLRKGVYPGDYLVWYAAAPFEGPGDEQPYLNEYDHPIQVRAVEPTDSK